ncbi:hypothetical protein PITCH_A1760002 [uncultured Desulfobacterium sp.]|uniref:Uncharacterized protein n=1 Tax=uncultured Desulfobacterium sp. TaxID=201089 RepID=A0A445MV82_9BACT|nr:hypothetical protein PITCH_A1760002 [uncultured Desulfobacterium sp.]
MILFHLANHWCRYKVPAAKFIVMCRNRIGEYFDKIRQRYREFDWELIEWLYENYHLRD